MLLDIDFISGAKLDVNSTQSYDAIAVRFMEEGDPAPKIVIIDGGFTDVGEDVVRHVKTHFGTDRVDLVVSTHPDQDHIGGLPTVLEELDVRELAIHQPHSYAKDLSEFSNLNALESLLGIAKRLDVPVCAPYTGITWFDGRIAVLGPSEDYYQQLVSEQLDAELMNSLNLRMSSSSSSEAVGSILGAMPEETLGDGGETTPRNNSSVIMLLQVAGRRHLFTGDAGVPAIEAAIAHYERTIGSLAEAPLSFMQLPHHGSKRNLSQALVDRIVGEPGACNNPDLVAFAHAAKASEKHPSPKITNALMRRGVLPNKIASTNGKGLWHRLGGHTRAGYSDIMPYPILAEDDDV